MANRKFSSIAFKESHKEGHRLYLALKQFYYAIETSAQIPQEDVDDLCACLKDRQFYDFAKSIFPSLCELDDERISNADPVMVQVLKAAEQHLPPKPLPLAADHYPTVLARLWTNLLSELVQGAKDEFTPQGQAALALSIRPLFEALGTVVPGELDKAARSGQIGRLAGAGGTEFLNRTVHHQDAKPQPEDTMTQTGVINGGATCYQNVTIRQVQSSPAARNAIFSNPIAEEGEEEGEEAERVRNDLHRIIYKMLECIQQENFEDSKKLLVKMWQVFKDEKSAFAPDWRQQDAEEFLTQVFLKHFEGELKSAWGHITETQFMCLNCKTPSAKTNESNVVYSLPIPTSGSINMMAVLNNSFIKPVLLTKDCGSCGVNRDFSAQTHLVTTEGKEPEIIFQIKRFGNAGRKLATEVRIPQWLVAVPGADCWYYVKYIQVHVGRSIDFGHYFSFERGSLGVLEERQPDEEEEREAGEGPGGMAFFTRKDQQEKDAENSFQTWTKYNDNMKATGVKFSEIEKHFDSWYQLTLVPATKADIAELLDSVAYPQRNLVYKAIAAFYRAGTDVEEIFVAHGEIVGLIRDALLTHFKVIGGVLQDEFGANGHESGSEEGTPPPTEIPTDVALEVGFNAFSRLNADDSPPLSQERQQLYEQATTLALAQLKQHWEFSTRDTPENRAKKTWKGIFGAQNLLNVTLKAARQRIRNDRAALEQAARDAFVEQYERDAPARAAARAAEAEELAAALAARKAGDTAGQTDSFGEAEVDKENQRLIELGLRESMLNAGGDGGADQSAAGSQRAQPRKSADDIDMLDAGTDQHAKQTTLQHDRTHAGGEDEQQRNERARLAELGVPAADRFLPPPPHGAADSDAFRPQTPPAHTPNEFATRTDSAQSQTPSVIAAGLGPTQSSQGARGMFSQSPTPSAIVRHLGPTPPSHTERGIFSLSSRSSTPRATLGSPMDHLTERMSEMSPSGAPPPALNDPVDWSNIFGSPSGATNATQGAAARGEGTPALVVTGPPVTITGHLQPDPPTSPSAESSILSHITVVQRREQRPPPSQRGSPHTEVSSSGSPQRTPGRSALQGDAASQDRTSGGRMTFGPEIADSQATLQRREETLEDAASTWDRPGGGRMLRGLEVADSQATSQRREETMEDAVLNASRYWEFESSGTPPHRATKHRPDQAPTLDEPPQSPQTPTSEATPRPSAPATSIRHGARDITPQKRHPEGESEGADRPSPTLRTARLARGEAEQGPHEGMARTIRRAVQHPFQSMRNPRQTARSVRMARHHSRGNMLDLFHSDAPPSSDAPPQSLQRQPSMLFGRRPSGAVTTLAGVPPPTSTRGSGGRTAGSQASPGPERYSTASREDPARVSNEHAQGRTSPQARASGEGRTSALDRTSREGDRLVPPPRMSRTGSFSNLLGLFAGSGSTSRRHSRAGAAPQPGPTATQTDDSEQQTPRGPTRRGPSGTERPDIFDIPPDDD